MCAEVETYFLMILFKMLCTTATAEKMTSSVMSYWVHRDIIILCRHLSKHQRNCKQKAENSQELVANDD